MVKTITSILIVACLLIVGAIYENNFVTKQFNEMHEVLVTPEDRLSFCISSFKAWRLEYSSFTKEVMLLSKSSSSAIRRAFLL